ncbi:MAG: hypothetical protein ABSG05_01520 [Candidatus Pacearchaeota archaeon]|jgi:hypothetical protein
MIKEDNFKEKAENYTFSKKTLVALFLIAGFLVLTILFFTNKVSADTPTNSYCCEKTTSNQWCQNVNDPFLCATGNGLSSPAPTSCQSTSYCELGTCVNGQEGTCLPNVPGQVCQNSGGTWINGQPANIPQCQLGCCLIADQAAFVTQTRCSFLSAQAGVNSTFRTDITDEQTCIASANPQVDGACVLDTGFSRTCRRLTRGECQQLQSSSNGNTTVEFHEGLLCSATSLATNCGQTKNTECVPGKDQVYFVDSCGNMANVYDESRINDPSYWTNIQDPSTSCNFGSSNANSATCGNCDYISGSVCKAFQRGSQQTQTAPKNGNFVCADLSCHFNGQTYEQGASWCISNTAQRNQNLPGSEDAVQKCFDGEVTTELCDPFRNQICLQTTSNGNFPVANCVVNRWQDCTTIDNQQDCLDTNQRDCQWVNITSTTDSNGNALTLSSNGSILVPGEGKAAACVPKYSPGFEFYNSTDSSTVNPEAICAQANQNCVVKFTKKLLSDTWKCAGNCQCIGLKQDDTIPGGVQGVSQWVSQRMGMCVSLGDCGNLTNYIGKPGYPTTAVTISKA